jgi:hypothetical protein
VSVSPKPGDLRVWWIPQIPGNPFHVAVPDVATARQVCDLLAAYDLFQLEEGIKPDYCNMGGVEQYEGDPDDPGWFSAYDENDNDVWPVGGES